jgi:hypothetical protein
VGIREAERVTCVMLLLSCCMEKTCLGRTNHTRAIITMQHRWHGMGGVNVATMFGSLQSTHGRRALAYELDGRGNKVDCFGNRHGAIVLYGGVL